MGAIYTIPATCSFVDTLAAGLLARAANDPMQLAAMTVLLPNRRACRNLREAFLRKSGGTPLLLPDIRPIGDVDEDALSLGAGMETLGDATPIHPLRRQLMLARYLTRAYPDRFTIAQALPMAAELGRLLDSIHTEGLDLARLDTLAPEKYAAHWGIILDFLKRAIARHWPTQLRTENALDPGAWRIAMIRAYTEHLRANPPAGPVIAAGSTGSIPATADLIKTVAELPQGLVVLPGLDRVLDDESWNTHIEEGHPQAGLQRLLDHIGINRAQIRDWDGVPPPGDRERLIAAMMRPAGTLHRWKEEPLEATCFEDVALVEAANLAAESGAIAAIMRAHIADETNRDVCVLVTPDRVLAGRVAYNLARWGIAIDDSAGRKLSRTPVGAWLLLLVDLLDGEFSPVALLAALKSPLAGGGAAWPAEAPPYRSFVRLLDRHILRGLRPAPGFTGLHHALNANRHLDPAMRDAIRAGLRALEKIFAPAALAASPSERLRALALLAENLAAAPPESGAQRLWSGDAGEAAADMFSTLFEHSDILPDLDWSGAHAVLESAMEGVSIRPRFGTHPRLAILGQIEARLYQAHTMILGGLNEGAWPRLPEVDGWMSRGMRADFGLPAPERATTLSAHDFAQGMGAAKVILTRSKTRDGAPAIAARWLQRLDAVCECANVKDLRARGEKWLDLAAAMDRPDAPPCATDRPVANPPLDARPWRLRVTDIEKLRGEPYGVYARHVLALKPLDPLEAEPDARERGTLVHAALERFLGTFPTGLPMDAREQLQAIGEKVFADAHAHPDVYGHWWPRFLKMTDALLRHEREWRQGMQTAWAERDGTMEMNINARAFTLAGRADRIERRADGWAIIDYKTGAAPAKNKVLQGEQPQLTLLGAMLLAGGFDASLGIAAPPDALAALAYWGVGGSGGALGTTAFTENLDTLCTTARADLETLLRRYLQDGMPYECWPDPAYRLPDDYEYAHLGRIAEWSSEFDDETQGEEAA